MDKQSSSSVAPSLLGTVAAAPALTFSYPTAPAQPKQKSAKDGQCVEAIRCHVFASSALRHM